MARHLAPFSCRQTIAEMVRRRSFGCVLPLGRHASTNGSKLIHCASDSIALSSFQEGQNARHHNRCKREQALEIPAVWVPEPHCNGVGSPSDTHLNRSADQSVWPNRPCDGSSAPKVITDCNQSTVLGRNGHEPACHVHTVTCGSD